QSALNRHQSVLGAPTRNRRTHAGAPKRRRQRVLPSREITLNLRIENIAGSAERDHANEANATAGTEVVVGTLYHGVNRADRIVGTAKRCKNIRLEPMIDFSQHFGCHLLFAVRKEMIKAALAEAGGLTDQAQ